MPPKKVKKKKDANNEADREETLVTHNPVVKELRYFNIFKCGKNILDKIGATCKRACMTKSIVK